MIQRFKRLWQSFIANKPLQFYLILFVMMVFQTVMFHDIASLMRQPEFVNILIIAIVDVLIILLPFVWLSPRWRWTFGVAVALYTFWLISNAWYSRTYFELMPLKSYLLFENVSSVLIDSTLGSILWRDLWVLTPPVLIAVAYYLYYKKALEGKVFPFRKTMTAIVLVVFLGFNVWATYLEVEKRIAKRYTVEYFLSVTGERLSWHHSYFPPLSDYYYINGGVAFWVKEAIGWSPGADLTEEEKEKIEEFIASTPKGRNNDIDSLNVNKNLILVMAESLSSWVIDFKIDGNEVTPTLNSFFHDNETFAIRNVLSQVTNGRTSDGHFIYNTGLLPCRSTQTVIHFGDVPYPSIAKALKAKGYYAFNILSDDITFWNQATTSRSYGFDKTYEKGNYSKGNKVPMNKFDSVILPAAVNYFKTSKSPFYAMAVTLSMHSPWRMIDDSPQWIKDAQLKDEVKKYLSVAHFFDSQLKNFIDQLKENGLYDNSVVVIASDHEGLCRHVVDGREKLEPGDRFIPVVILNSGVNTKHNDVVGQIDIFPTILDVMGADEYEWKGVGHSLLREKVTSAVTSDGVVVGDSTSALSPRQKEAWNISNSIILSRYFDNAKGK